jgi:tetratricopeptide (TPR) repeat protein
VQLIIWFASVASLAVALLLWLSEHDPSKQTMRLWMGFLFLGLGLTLIWLGVRAGKPWRLSPPEGENFVEGYNFKFYRQLTREILSARSALGAQAAGNFEAALQARDWSRVLVEADRLAIEHQANPAVALYRGEALLELTRHAEATAAVESMLAQAGLGWALRTSACIVRLRALLRDSCVEPVTAAVDAWCSSDVPLVSKLVLLDGIVCEILYGARRGLLPVAESWARKAVALCPTDLSIKGSLGSVLVESGRHEEAEPLLRETYEQSLSPNDQRICAFYLALIAKSRNQTNLAHRLAAEALEARDQPWLVARVQIEFPNLSGSRNQKN